MLKHLEKHTFIYLTFLGALTLLFFFYHTVLLAPNDFLFSANGDGIKNYYTYIYHAKYDTSFAAFSGMNYPYYEHIVYTDAHPLLSWLIGKLGLVNYAVGILNLLILLSYPIAAAFLYKILAHYKVQNWWALLAAIAISFLSPQVFRMTGHFSMAYVFAVPIMWWLLIKCYSTKKWSWSIATGAYLLAFFFTHPYLGIILAFFSIVFWLIQLVIDRKKIVASLLHIFIQTVLPLGFFRGYIALTDTHVDRLSNPAGFFNYYASWKSLLIPHDGPLKWVSKDFSINIGNWESWCYIGFPTLVFAVIIGTHLFKNRKGFAIKPFLKKELLLFLIAAYLILLFAFCFPLKYNWLRWITDLFGPLKQFRILGRFTWIFFYVFTVACIVGIHQLAQKKQGKLYPILFFAGILFYGLEFAPAHFTTANYISQAENAFKPEKVDPALTEVITFIDDNDYDALLFLPFQHMSSENLMLLGAEKANYDAFLLSYHTHLPLVNSISSRMSLTEAIKVNNYFSPGFMEKEFTYDLPPNDRIAVIKNRDLLSTQELRMIWESEQIFENEQFVIFDFDPKKWNSRKHFDKVLAQEKLATTPLNNGWFSDTSNVWFYYENYDSVGTVLPADQLFAGKGAFKDNKTGWNTILTLDEKELPAGDYIIKYWYQLRIDRPDVNAVVQAKYQQKDSLAWIAQFDVKQSTVIVNDWCLVEMEFTLSEDVKTTDFLITGNGSKEPFIVDELLIQKQNDAHLFKRAEIDQVKYIVYDNYWLKAASFEPR